MVNSTSKNSDNTMPIVTHLMGLLVYFVGPFAFIGPLVVMLSSEDKIVRNHARVALNWQLSLLIYSFISAILILLIIGFLLLFALTVLNLIFVIVGTIKASEGNIWEYPLTIPFLKQE